MTRVPRILLYYPSNARSVALETLVLQIHRRGVPIQLLTTCPPGPFHEALRAEGVPVFAHPVGKSLPTQYYPRQIAGLVRHCNQHGITTVFSHLQHANLIAVLAQPFLLSRVIVFRHHFKFVFPEDGIAIDRNRNERFFDRVINVMAKTIVVPSHGVHDGMLATEAVDPSRLRVLPYMYDFSRYPRPDPARIATLRARYDARLRLAFVSRLIPHKRAHLVLRCVRDLLREGLDILLLVLGTGPESDDLESLIRAQGLQDRVVMLGHRSDVLDYLAAADLLVHPSLTEASSNVVKESGLVSRSVLVCQGVGDFDEYIRSGVNGFVVPRTTDGSEIMAAIRRAYRDPAILESMGRRLNETVLSRFSVSEERVQQYLALAGHVL